VALLLGNGDGTFATGTGTVAATGNGPRSLIAGDFGHFLAASGRGVPSDAASRVLEVSRLRCDLDYRLVWPQRSHNSESPKSVVARS
jgi:hypothetical protein